MENVVSQFLSKGTAIIAVVVVILGFFIKRTIQICWPGSKPLANELDHKAMYTGKASLIYNQLFLYALPVALGTLVALVSKDPFLYGDDIKTTSGRVFYAAVVGWFSDFLYEVVQKSLYKTTGVLLPSPGDPEIPVEVEHKHDHE